jgi:uncharacterized protein (TIGR00369 family)
VPGSNRVIEGDELLDRHGFSTSEVDQEATATVQNMIPYAKTMKIEVLGARPDEVRGRLQWDAGLCTADGRLHGGVLMGIADNLGGVCAFMNLPHDAAGTTTIESKTNFFRAVRSDYVETTSKLIHVGKSVIVVQTDVTDADGRMVARVTQSQLVLYRG